MGSRVSTVGTRVAVWAVLVVGTVALTVVVGAPPERCPDADEDQLRAAAVETVGWFVRNQDTDGEWLYEYHRDGGPVDTNYNIVRHAGVMSGLYQAASAGIDGALESADDGLAWANDRLVPANGGTAIADTEATVAKAGASALLLSGLIERRVATADDQYDPLLRDLGRFLVGQMEPGGAFLGSFDLARDVPIPDSYSRYYTGESYWALARLHNLFPDEGWGAAADRIGNYMSTQRDAAEEIFPPLPDHWAGYGLAETAVFPDRPAATPLTDHELAYTRRQAGLFGAQVRFLSQMIGPWGGLVRVEHEPRGGGYGVLGEGLTGLWFTARADERLDDLSGTIGDRAVCNAGMAVAAQSDAADAASYSEPGKVQGAWFRDDITRMDDMQHALSALLRTIPILEQGDLADGEGSTRQAPSVWLWLPILVLATNPARAALGTPRDGRRRDEVLRLAAVGAAIGALAVLVLSALGVWFVDVIGVSDASFRIAAGAVGLLGGIADLVRRAPSPDPSLPGPRAALVPVAVPLLIRPALVVLAVSATADHAWWLTLGGVVLAGGLFISLTPFIHRDGVSGRVARWAARSSGVLLAAGSVLLIVNGVLDV